MTPSIRGLHGTRGNPQPVMVHFYRQRDETLCSLLGGTPLSAQQGISRDVYLRTDYLP